MMHHIIFACLFFFTQEQAQAKYHQLNDDVEVFRFASSFQDNMVLQMEPHKAAIWGYGAVGAIVNVSLIQDVYSTKVIVGPNDTGVWRVVLKPHIAGGPHTLQAVHDDHGLLNWLLLKNVLFGDVWICGGQSNMEFTVSMGNNASKEINASINYPNIRVMTPALVWSDFPLDDFQKIEQPWSIASPASIGGPAWTYFSAVCWFYGQYLYDHLKVPIGLISSSAGGTSIEVWSSYTALKKCGIASKFRNITFEIAGDAFNNSALWNSMIKPLLNMTIKGVIWYQGESNTLYHTSEYTCSFPALIQDWRSSWFEGTRQLTDPSFPFGFVQLSSYYAVDDGSYPLIRWHQTADYGFAPNVKMPNTFMAVAIDLGDPTSPSGSIHPRNKQTVAQRLLAGALNIVYGKNISFQGPIAYKADGNARYVTIRYQSQTKIRATEKRNFEVCCNTAVCDYEQPYNTSSWQIAPLVTHTHKTVVLNVGSCLDGGGKAKFIRYAWQIVPCNLTCSVYNKDGLPSAPFLLSVTNQ